MTTVHQAGHGDTTLQRLDEKLKNVIVTNLAITFKIDWNQRFVVSVIFVAVLIWNTTAMACIDIVVMHD